MLDFSVQLTLEGETLTEEERREILSGTDGLSLEFHDEAEREKGRSENAEAASSLIGRLYVTLMIKSATCGYDALTVQKQGSILS